MPKIGIIKPKGIFMKTTTSTLIAAATMSTILLFQSTATSLPNALMKSSEGLQCIDVSSMGNYNYAPDGRSGAAAMVGNIEGAVSFRQIGDFKDVGGGRSEGRFEHMFVTTDGSTLRTNDLSWGRAVPNTDYIVGGAAYTVVEGTGRFAGFSGTFNSWGTFAPKKRQAVLRYSGQICKS
jgi:hypothetical protein